MKIKDIDMSPEGITREEAIKFFYLLMCYSNDFEFIQAKYYDNDNLYSEHFDNSINAMLFISDLELEKLDEITFEFRVGAVAKRFKINFNRPESPEHVIINVTGREV